MANVETLANDIAGLNINASESPQMQSPSPAEASLLERNSGIISEDIKEIFSLAGRLEELRNDLSHDPTALCRQAGIIAVQATELEKRAHILKSNTRDAVLAKLVEFGGHVKDKVKKLRREFKEPIEKIVEDTLEVPGSGNDSLIVRGAERCYQEAKSPDGTLNYQRSSLYQDSHDEEGIEQIWINFWTQIFAGCLRSTLFDPSAVSNCGMHDFDLDNIPPYLFRVFALGSEGRNDNEVIASWVSVDGEPHDRVDLLSTEREKPTSLLCKHCIPCKPKDRICSDNLVSWTSSLLPAIQCAIAKRHIWDEKEIKICVVDTEKFPRGQFIRDIQLHTVYSRPGIEECQSYFFNFRLNENL